MNRWTVINDAHILLSEIVAIEPMHATEEVKGYAIGVGEYAHYPAEPDRVLVRLRGRLDKPYTIYFPSYDAAKERAAGLAKAVADNVPISNA